MKENCNICGNKDAEVIGSEFECLYIKCPNCGRYIVTLNSAFLLDDSFSIGNKDRYDKSKLKKYLFYNKINNRNAFIGTKQALDNYVKLNPQSESFLVTSQMVEDWYPKTFAEKIDYMLLKLYSQMAFDGDYIAMSVLEETIFYSSSTSQTIDDNDNIEVQFQYIINYLSKNNLILGSGDYIQLTPKALERIYGLQKNQINNKNVFVAMSFNPAIETIYDAIDSAIRKAKCEVISMKHRIHNKQIVPEMLRLIKESKILVMDISEPNFGAYYEAGYAQGLGKEVIFTCKSSVMKKDKFPCDDKKGEECELLKKYSKPHFDIAQKQILVWEDEADLTEQLTEWIKFLIG